MTANNNILFSQGVPEPNILTSGLSVWEDETEVIKYSLKLSLGYFMSFGMNMLTSDGGGAVCVVRGP